MPLRIPPLKLWLGLPITPSHKMLNPYRSCSLLPPPITTFQLTEVEQRLDNMVKKMSMPGYAEKTPEAVRNDHENAKAKMEAERVAAVEQLFGMQRLAEAK